MTESVTKVITLKENTPDEVYSRFVDLAKKQGVFKACGNPDEKWIMVKFDNEVECLAWMVGMGLAQVSAMEE